RFRCMLAGRAAEVIQICGLRFKRDGSDFVGFALRIGILMDAVVVGYINFFARIVGCLGCQRDCTGKGECEGDRQQLSSHRISFLCGWLQKRMISTSSIAEDDDANSKETVKFWSKNRKKNREQNGGSHAATIFSRRRSRRTTNFILCSLFFIILEFL